MIIYALLALCAGLLVGLSRQINGRLALSTSAMESSFWNHLVGFLFISLIALLAGGLFASNPGQSPWWAYLGGPIGVIFIAAGSWLIPRIGAARTAIMIIAGQMTSGVVLDILRGASGDTAARVIGVLLILAGVWIAQSKPKQGVSRTKKTTNLDP
ncbi:transporter family-2 protein [Yoonia tamlensis]|uniref:Transporter family-2 protein n=1 Tax=Yoonia tamlensis TaxID=390270 RepID=A0A1I6FTR2_9RHOB|nr:DMT family transporter [Yoonia tamlensis]SFR33298.1 transporter family-2 protein [Yoonia tamlensis]